MNNAAFIESMQDQRNYILPHEWGPFAWTSLYRATLTSTASMWQLLMQLLPVILPCPSCRKGAYDFGMENKLYNDDIDMKFASASSRISYLDRLYSQIITRENTSPNTSQQEKSATVVASKDSKATKEIKDIKAKETTENKYHVYLYKRVIHDKIVMNYALFVYCIWTTCKTPQHPLVEQFVTLLGKLLNIAAPSLPTTTTMLSNACANITSMPQVCQLLTQGFQISPCWDSHRIMAFLTHDPLFDNFTNFANLTNFTNK